MSIKVIVHGAAGRMGSEVLRALCREDGLEAVGAVDLQADRERLPLPDGCGQIPYSPELSAIIEATAPQVMVDFSVHHAVLPAARLAAARGVNLVVGTTGLTPQDMDELEELCRQSDIGAVVAANFSIGAVLMIHLAAMAARHFDYAEVVEKHHEAKVDAPSGTALATVRAMAAARGKPFRYTAAQKENLPGTRGGQLDGVGVHSMRLPGLMAHQEVVMGSPGQTLSICHDTISREAFMPGVVMAIKHAAREKGLVHGLESLLGL